MAKIKFSDIGAMNNLIVAEKLSISQDSIGAIHESWSVIYEIWAAVQPLRSIRDYIELQNVQHSAMEIQMRYEPELEVSKDIRFVIDGVIHTINSWKQYTVGRKRYWNIIAIQQV